MKRGHGVALPHPPRWLQLQRLHISPSRRRRRHLPHPTPRFASRRRAAMACAAASVGITHDTGVNVSSAESVGQNDLLIVGPGMLGRIVAEKWQQEHPGCKIFGQTASTDHHSELTEIGIIPSLKGSRFGQKVPYVIFCAPPYRTDDYPGDLRSPRTDNLLKAENIVLEAGGCVLRLAGLYKTDQGPHVFWLSKGTVDARPDHIINLIHYEDAASLAIAIMKKRLRGHVFVGCDNQPLSRQEIMDSVNTSGKFDTKFQGFTGTDGPLGKRIENSKTRAEIGWQPKYRTFTEFLGLGN